MKQEHEMKDDCESASSGSREPDESTNAAACADTKPSERISAIARTLLTPYNATSPVAAGVRAIIMYLDEEYERTKK